jgi:hypothetical protein
MKTDKRPVFPSTFHNFSDRNEFAPDGQLIPPRSSAQVTGMTLRQLYAANAMQGYLASMQACPEHGPIEPTEYARAIARDCWIMADALIATENGGGQ